MVDTADMICTVDMVYTVDIVELFGTLIMKSLCRGWMDGWMDRFAFLFSSLENA